MRTRVRDPDLDERQVTAVVLAAGASSRMGRPKALLTFDGQSCLALVLGACRDGGVSRVVMVTGPQGGAVREEAARTLPIIAAVNEQPERGMLTSLQADAAGFLIFPVDFPLAPAVEVRRLLAAFAGRAPGQRIFIPSFERRRGHPVLVDAALAPEFLALPEDASARAVMTVHAGEIVHVEAADDRVLVDMDTPEDYQRCLARHRRGADE